MSFSEKFVSMTKKVLPMPFTIAVLLTLAAMILAMAINTSPPPSKPDNSVTIQGVSKEVSPVEIEALKKTLQIESYPPAKDSDKNRILQVLIFWEMGFWDLLGFAMQMVLILVLGHALALTKPVRKLIERLALQATNTANAAAIVAFAAVTMGLFNWGLGLIFGALLARKVGEKASERGFRLNYPLICAAGYAAMMVWHGGFSASAPLKVAEADHFFAGLTPPIPPNETIFSSLNVVVSVLLLLALPAILYFLGKIVNSKPVNIQSQTLIESSNEIPSGAEKLDHSRLLAYLFAALILGLGIYMSTQTAGITPFSFLTLNYVNFMLLGLGVLLHGSFRQYLRAIDKAVGGASGIIIQFPLYAGIMGILEHSGLIHEFAALFIQLSNETTLPLFTFFSAAIVNVFVPSGGGQWAVQGPIVIQSALDIGVPVSKNIMALAYGDQLSNMIQPFWALPLLSITGLKAKDILPFSFIIMLIGIVIFLSCLMLF